MIEKLTAHLIDEHSWQEAMSLTVRPEQQCFVADFTPIAAVGFAKAFVRPGGKVWLPYGLYAETAMVGFFVLAFAEKVVADAWLFHFFIDQRYQRRGYGADGMQLVMATAKKVYPEGQGLSLVVHPDNLAAQRLYKRVGFQATGELKWGESVYRFVF